MAKRLGTFEKPGSPIARNRKMVGNGGGRPPLPSFDWNAVRPVGKGEVFPFFTLGVVLAFFATLVCFGRGYVLLYGDAVAHLAIARRILDARYPGMSQLGGVWLPLPHLLTLPFVQKMVWWQSGLSGAPMSIFSYALSVAGVWRLSRRWMSMRWALVAVAFYALNANLLYLASTAMTEALFLALLVWTTVATVEGVAALRAGEEKRARSWMLGAGALILGMVFTRYDGWIVGAVVWCVFARELWRSALRQRLMIWFVVFTVLCVAGPLFWFWFNHHYMDDWLDFMRGPYSAKQIERRTAPPGQHYRGWKNPGWALLFYLRTAQIDASFWETGWLVMIAALAGLWWSVRRADPTSEIPKMGHPFGVEDARKLTWLLWVPLPFYVYSVAYGSVPIFIPQLWPHSYYNARYGMEMLPALAIYTAYAGWLANEWLRPRSEAWAKIANRFAQPVAMLLCVANCVAMMYFIPLVLKEGMVNATTRQALEKSIARVIETVPQDVPVMMYTSAHVGAVQVAGRTLKSMVSEQDWDSWHKALEAPSQNAAMVIAIKGDPVDDAVKAHPEGLTLEQVVCTTGQPCARIYHSDAYSPKR